MSCSINNCTKAVYGRGLCEQHYKRLWRHGSPTGGSTGKGAGPAFLKQALQLQSHDCLLWPFARASNGNYGAIGREGKMLGAHVWVCEAAHGSKPSPKHVVAHSCGNSLCVNPRHLRWATTKENHADKLMHGTDGRGEKHSGAKLTAKQVQTIRTATGKTQRQLAEEFGVTQTNISHILLRKSWQS